MSARAPVLPLPMRLRTGDSGAQHAAVLCWHKGTDTRQGQRGSGVCSVRAGSHTAQLLACWSLETAGLGTLFIE